MFSRYMNLEEIIKQVKGLLDTKLKNLESNIHKIGSLKIYWTLDKYKMNFF